MNKHILYVLSKHIHTLYFYYYSVDYDITSMSSAPKCECEVFASNLKLKSFYVGASQNLIKYFLYLQ